MQIKKLFLIAIKDLRLIFRDPSALVLMLLAPFVLTIGMGALTGRFSGGTGSGISNIPVILVNKDEGHLGEVLVEVFQSPDLAELVAAETMNDVQRAKALVDEDQSTAVIHIPEGFTNSIIPSTETSEPEDVQIVFYANPTQPTSAGVVRSILDQFINRVELGKVSGQVIVRQLVENGLISPAQAGQVGQEISQEIAQMDVSRSAITIQSTVSEDEGIQFDILAYMAPGMAIMFLMFTVTYGGRSLLVENYQGTLPRLLVAPTLPAYVLGGKAFGIFLTAVAQMAILIGGTSLMFRLEWGDTLGVILLILTAAFAATGWGMFFAAILKTPGQIAITGSPVMLLFGILGGSFFDLSMLPDWIQVVNKITPNAWAVDGFRILSFGGGLDDIFTNIIALVVMGLVLFMVASLWMRKSGLARK